MASPATESLPFNRDYRGSLEVGRGADIAVLQIIDEPTKLRDSVGGEMTYNQRIAARWTIRSGQLFPGSQPSNSF